MLGAPQHLLGAPQHLLGPGEQQVTLHLVDADTRVDIEHGPQRRRRLAADGEEVKPQLRGQIAAHLHPTHAVATGIEPR
ncbi:hypothetical protein MBOE_30490 [Mycolicibacterium boenickei]|uniref:Uncharacterized protein n=1 Tax=Mycolicibacterium boenickei TaxID=146017 RepID=A0ABM7IX23_9MYCO|nr:hypothetical protein MBOE_30490 [Mycolicibacterium boenickei]